MGAGLPPKCKVCGKQLNVKTAYMVIVSNKNGTEKKTFYCNQEEYETNVLPQKKLLEEKKIERDRKKAEKELQKKETPARRGRPPKKKDEVVSTQPNIDKDIAYKLICDIMGKQQITNAILWKEWKLWNGIASDEIVRKYLDENKEYLTKRIARLDNVEYSRIRYLSAILKNSLTDFKPKPENLFALNIPDEHYETRYKPKVRVALLDIEEECYE